jgi:hypothetical protein
MVQGTRCGCCGTGQVGASGRLASVNLAANYSPHEILHADCVGAFVAFDIGVEA